MQFKVSGNHSIDQNINYVINAVIPRAKFQSAQLGKTVNSALSTLEKEANARGVKLDIGENIFLDILITGTITKPEIKILPVGSGGKGLDRVIEDKIKKEVTVLKDTISKELEKKTEKLKDSLTRVVDKKLDTLGSQIKDKVKKESDVIGGKIKDKVSEKLDSTLVGTKVDSLGKKVEDKVADILGKNSKKDIDSIKSKINDWNPFKKNKKQEDD
jgi:hypothetical protein